MTVSAGMPAAARASSQDVLLELGALRQKHGLPAVTEDARLSAACRALMTHRRANGGTVGDRAQWPEAARALSWWIDPGSWGIGGSRPTALFPNADAGLVDPTTTRVGLSDGCLGFTWERPDPPPAAQLLSFPGDGSTDAPYEVVALREFPQANVSEFLGGPARTGPYIRVFAWGGGLARVAPGLVGADVSASLVDQRGVPIPVRASANGRLAGWSRVGTAVVVPTVPLAPREWYRAAVTYVERDTGVQATRTWRFRTAGRPPDTTVSVSGHGELVVSSSSAASIRVRLTRAGRSVVLGPFGRGTSVVPLPVEPGRYRMCIDQAAVGPYDGAEWCETVDRSWAAPVRLQARRLRAGRIALTATAPAVAHGLRIRAWIVGSKVGDRWVRVRKGGLLHGTLGTRSARWIVSGRFARRSVSALLVRTETGTGPGNEGQRWLAVRREHDVTITSR